MNSRTRPPSIEPRRLERIGAIVAITALVLAACRDGADGGGAAGEGVEPGASKNDYRAALQDMDPVTLIVQSQNAPGKFQSRGLEAWSEAVEDFSGGKITMEFRYSHAVSDPAGTDDALADGRVDVSPFYPGYDPERYPAFNVWSRADAEGISDPYLGTTVYNLRVLESGFATPELKQETEREGVHVLVPWTIADPLGLGCTSDRSTVQRAKGALTRVNSSGLNTQTEALEMTPVSMEFTEVFEGLQRGAVDCTISTPATGLHSGLLEVTKEWAMSTEVNWSTGFTPLGIGQSRWDELPLAARQLLHDRLDVYVETQLRTMMDDLAKAMTTIEKAGGSVRVLGDGASAALERGTDKLLDGVRKTDVVPDGNALIERHNAAGDRWTRFLSSRADFQEVPYDRYATWYERNRNRIDLDPVIDRVRTEILDKHRPTGTST